MIYILEPYRTDKDLGKAYNDAISLLPEDAWVCVKDIDCMFLTPDAPEIMQKYVDLYPETGVFTCFTNRISQLAHEQLLNKKVSFEPNILVHIEKAIEKTRDFPSITPVLRGEISGYLMLFSKKTWAGNKFQEGIGCLAVDTYWSRKIVASGKSIMRMDAIYVWHTYRLWKAINDKEHLK